MSTRLLPICYAAFLAVALIFLSCQKSDIGYDGIAEHSTDLAFPVFSTTLNIADLLPKLLSDTLEGDTLLVNPDRSLTLYYTGKVTEKKISEFYKLGDTTLLVPLFDTLTIYDDQSLPDSFTIRKANIKSGKLRFTVAKGAPEETSGRFIIREMTKNGVVFEMPFSVPANGNFVSPEIDLTGYELNSNQNKITYIYEAFTPSGVRVKYPDFFPGIPSVVVSSIQVNYSYLQGYWGYSELKPSKGRIELEINKINPFGELKVADPRITFVVENSFGFPIQGRIKRFFFIGKDGSKLNLESPYITPDGGVDYDYPSLADNEVGATVPTRFYFDKHNSNIVDIINATPIAVEYEVSIVANPKKDNSIIGFMTDSSKVGFSIEVELPLEGSAKNFGAEQILELDFDKLADLENEDFELDSIELKLVADNGLPLAFDLQLEFLNANGKPVDSLFSEGPRRVMLAAPVDGLGVVSERARTETFIGMDAKRFDKIKKAKQARVRSSMTTSKDGTVPVRIFSDMETILKMGARAKVRQQ